MTYDVIIIGGGPAGLMAAISAKHHRPEVSVLLCEKTSRYGQKLLISGKGRCNLTTANSSHRDFVDAFHYQKGKFLYSILTQFDIHDTLNFFTSSGIPLKEERGRRIFPESDKAADILNLLLDKTENAGVIKYPQCSISKINRHPEGFELQYNGGSIIGKSCILCTGGKSYPATGSNGQGYFMAEQLGHHIIDPTPSLVPVLCEQTWVAQCEGLSLKHCDYTLWIDGKSVQRLHGEAAFTRQGLTGPVILNLSRLLTHVDFNRQRVMISIDLKPGLSEEQLDKRLIRDFRTYANRDYKNALNDLLPSSLIPVIVQLSEIPPEQKVHSITQNQRKILRSLLKDCQLNVIGMDGFEKAIVTHGGVDLNEVDSKTMQSKRVPGFFFAGEIIDLDGPTGGYNLQLCWSTGYVAGHHAADVSLNS